MTTEKIKRKQKEYSINDIETEGLVKIKVIETVKGRPRVLENARKTLAPYFDKHGGLITGTIRKEWEKWSEILGKTVNDQFWKDFSVVLTKKGKDFDLSVPYNRLIVAFLKAHYEVALADQDILPNNSFVIYDEVEKAKEKNLKFNEELKAMMSIGNMTAVERGDFLKLFGYKTESMNPELIQSRLVDQAKSDPIFFNTMFADQNKEIRVLIKDLLYYEILHKKDGAIMHGDTLIGATEDLAVFYLADSDNQNTLVTLKKQLKAKKDRK